MSDERTFGKQQHELEANGVFRSVDDRDSFISNLREMYNLAVEFDREYYSYDDADPSDLFENYSPLTLEVLNNIASGVKVDGDVVSSEIDAIIDILDGGDMDDAFGTEGWRHRLGWN